MEPIARPISAATLPLDPAGRIDADIPCRKCGYNLRGLLPDGVCPECATAVGRSLHGDLLRFCDPDWVQTLASGMNWIVWGIIIGVALSCAGGGLGSLLMSFRPRGIATLPVTGAKLVGTVVAMVGYWMVTTPDPGRVAAEPSHSSRRLVRITQVIGLLLAPTSLGLGIIPSLLQILLAIGSSAAWIVGIFAIFMYARHLALRIPDDTLARNTRIVMWGVVVVVALFVATTVAGLSIMVMSTAARAPMATTMPTSGPGGLWSVTVINATPGTMPATTVSSTASISTTATVVAALLPIAGCGTGIGGIVFGIWSLRLIDRYRKALRESAEIARHTWAA